MLPETQLEAKQRQIMDSMRAGVRRNDLPKAKRFLAYIKSSLGSMKYPAMDAEHLLEAILDTKNGGPEFQEIAQALLDLDCRLFSRAYGRRSTAWEDIDRIRHGGGLPPRQTYGSPRLEAIVKGQEELKGAIIEYHADTLTELLRRSDLVDAREEQD